MVPRSKPGLINGPRLPPCMREHLSVKPQEGVRSTENWSDFAGQFNPMLTEEVLLCEREDAAKQLIQDLLQPSNIVSLMRILRTRWWPLRSRRSARRPRMSGSSRSSDLGRRQRNGGPPAAGQR